MNVHQISDTKNTYAILKATKNQWIFKSHIKHLTGQENRTFHEKTNLLKKATHEHGGKSLY